MSQLDIEFSSKFDDQIQAEELAELNKLSKMATDNAANSLKATEPQNLSVKQLFDHTVAVMASILQDLIAGRPLSEVFLAADRVMYVGFLLIVVCVYTC